MKKSFSRSLLMWPVLATCLTLTAFGQQPSLVANDATGRAPVATYTPPSRAPLYDATAGTYNYWDSLASTDYYNVIPSILIAPNPDIAVGPDDIIVLVNRQIARYPNPNAAGNPKVTSPWIKAPLLVGTQPTSKADLAVWLGEANLAVGCPTVPRTNSTCVIDNTTVRYDQMQGRFLVVFTITDTVARKASWVLLASKFATFNQGTPNTTEVFTTPNPPGPNQDNPSSGGPAASNWISYLSTGTDINIILGSTTTFAPEGVAAANCAPKADPNATLAGFCYFPTSARVGLDNDNIIIASAVINDNIAQNTRATGTPAYAGTRLRVFKKNTVYGGYTITSLTAGNSLALLQGTHYDLFPTTVGVALGNFYLLAPYTLEPVVSVDGAASASGLFYEPTHLRGRALASFSGNANLGPCVNTPNNQIPCIGSGGPGTTTDIPAGLTSLIGARSTENIIAGNAATDPGVQTTLYVRTINYTRMFQGVNTEPTTNPVLPINGASITGGIPFLDQTLETVTVPFFKNPATVIQRDILAGGTPPRLGVGDDRPQRVVAREGHMYSARVADQSMSEAYDFDSPNALSATVVYDIIQKLGPTPATPPRPIINTKWNNGRFYAPMFDVTPNVIQYGSVSPVQLISYFDKLFVGTTYAPLAPTDPRALPPYLTETVKSVCRGQEPGVPAQPSVTNRLAFASLFDIRCGEDAYDTKVAYRSAVTGALNENPADALWSQRGGAGIDPNNGTLWVYGAYALGRQASIPGAGQWGTHIANYDMTFSATDMYNNAIVGYPDVPPSHQFYRFIQIAKQTDIAPGGRTATGNFNPLDLVKRGEMAAWVIKAQMDDNAVNNYLAATGGVFTSFQDVPTTNANFKYIEVMYRRGYTKGCVATIDAVRRFCPDDNLTRGQMAVFLIRAKMNSVFPTVVSGTYTGSFGGDLFGLYTPTTTYFSDLNQAPDFAPYINKMRELRITNGTGDGTTYSPNQTLTRGEIAAFIVRAFFF